MPVSFAHEGPTGVMATTNREAILRIEADCCVYMPRADRERGHPGRTHQGSGRRRRGGVAAKRRQRRHHLYRSDRSRRSAWRGAPWSSRRHVREGQHLPVGERERSRVHHRDRPHGVALGAASGGPDRDRGVRRSSRRPSPHMVMEQMRFGKPLSEFDPDRRKNHLFGEYQPALTVLADIAGFTIDEWTAGVASRRPRRTSRSSLARSERDSRRATDRRARPQRRRRSDPLHPVRLRFEGRRSGLGLATDGLADPSARGRRRSTSACRSPFPWATWVRTYPRSMPMGPSMPSPTSVPPARASSPPRTCPTSSRVALAMGPHGRGS